MTKMTTIVMPLIAILFAVGIQQTYAEEVTVDVPFVSDDEGCIYSYDKELNQFLFYCLWAMTPTAEEIIIIAEADPELVPEIVVDEAKEYLEPVIAEKSIPQTPAEIEIEKLTKKWIEEGELPSHEAQLLRALESFQKECELGTEEGAPIQTYEVFTIATFEPYTHTDLGTQYLLKEIELAIQECKAQNILKKKVLGDQYLHIPGLSDVKELWSPTAILPEDAQRAYDEAKMTDFNAAKSRQFAQQFQCSIEGKQQGHCIKEIGDTPIPKPTISQEGKAMLTKYKAFLETGITDIPEQDPDEEPDQDFIARQYLKAAGYSDEQIDAAMTAMEDEN